MSATDILKLCDEVLEASKAGTSLLPWRFKERTYAIKDANESLIVGEIHSFTDREDAVYITIAANCAPAMAEYIRRLHEAALAAGLDLDRMTLRGDGIQEKK